jgi:type IV pilus assembly protein PilV
VIAHFQRPNSSRGFTLIEVLITIVILAVGLLGLALLQMNSLANQLEAYQRAQAMLLLEDMASRLRVNSTWAKEWIADNTDGYPNSTTSDTVQTCSSTAPTTAAEIAALDLCQWNNALVGTGVTQGSTNLGGLVGATGCILNVAGSEGELLVRLSIAWQGASGTVVPNSTCGQNAFGPDDSLRRVASIDVVLGDLQ